MNHDVICDVIIKIKERKLSSMHRVERPQHFFLLTACNAGKIHSITMSCILASDVCVISNFIPQQPILDVKDLRTACLIHLSLNVCIFILAFHLIFWRVCVCVCLSMCAWLKIEAYCRYVFLGILLRWCLSSYRAYESVHAQASHWKLPSMTLWLNLV
jgi:hypothetical protein